MVLENPFKRTKRPGNPQESKKSGKSQTDLREIFNGRFLGMKGVIKDRMEEYEQALESGLFEDAEGEPEGSGEKRREAMQAAISASLDRAEKMKAILDSKAELPQHTNEIQATYKTESITMDFDTKIQEFKDLYNLTNINPPADFKNTIKEIWENNIDAIQKAIEENGFDEVLLIPGNISLPTLNSKMTDVYETTYEGSSFKSGGSFAGAKSQNTEKTRIVLVHKTQNLKDRPELKQTLNIKGEDVKLDHTLTLEDYLVFQRKYYIETNKHLDEEGLTWLATKSGPRLVDALWDPSVGRVYVNAIGLDFRDGSLGARPSRSFF